MFEKGQVDIEGIITGVIGIIIIVSVFIPLMTLISNTFKTTQCEDYQKQIDQLNIRISELEGQLSDQTLISQYWQDKYFNLTNTTVTKKDFDEIKSDISLLLNQINNTRSEVYNIQEQIINIKNIRNTYIAFSFLLSIDFAIFSLTILDLTIFRMKYSKILIEKLYKWRNKTKIDVRYKLNDEE